MNPFESIYKEFKSELLVELQHSIMEELTPKLKDLIKQAISEIKIEEEYQLVEWFTTKYPITKKTFMKYIRITQQEKADRLLTDFAKRDF